MTPDEFNKRLTEAETVAEGYQLMGEYFQERPPKQRDFSLLNGKRNACELFLARLASFRNLSKDAGPELKFQSRDARKRYDDLYNQGIENIPAAQKNPVFQRLTNHMNLDQLAETTQNPEPFLQNLDHLTRHYQQVANDPMSFS